MSILESAARLVTTVLALVGTRLELAAVELEEESRRLLNFLLLSLLSLFLFCVAIALAILFILLLYWDSYRMQAVLAMTGLFSALGVFVALKVRHGFATKPRLLAATLAELNKDIDFITTSSRHEK